MRYMFTMMNNARLSVGLEGLSLAERAFQMALAYAKERRQGRAPGAPAGEQSLIIDHPDVRRMLLTQKACIEALRGIIYANAAAMDRAARHPDEAVRTALRRAGRHPHAGVEGLGHRPRRGAHEPRPPGVRRHGLHRGDRHRPALPRRSHRPDLRGHQRHPGHGPRRPQAPDARRRAPSATTSARSRPPSTRWPPPATTSRRSTPALADGLDAAAHRHRLAPRQRPGRPARRAGRRHAVPAAVQPRHRRLGHGPAGAGGHAGCSPTPRRPTRTSTRARCSRPGSSASRSCRRPAACSPPSPPPTATSPPPSSERRDGGAHALARRGVVVGRAPHGHLRRRRATGSPPRCGGRASTSTRWRSRSGRTPLRRLVFHIAAFEAMKGGEPAARRLRPRALRRPRHRRASASSGPPCSATCGGSGATSTTWPTTTGPSIVGRPAPPARADRRRRHGAAACCSSAAAARTASWRRGCSRRPACRTPATPTRTPPTGRPSRSTRSSTACSTT